MYEKQRRRLSTVCRSLLCLSLSAFFALRCYADLHLIAPDSHCQVQVWVETCSAGALDGQCKEHVGICLNDPDNYLSEKWRSEQSGKCDPWPDWSCMKDTEADLQDSCWHVDYYDKQMCGGEKVCELTGYINTICTGSLKEGT